MVNDGPFLSSLCLEVSFCSLTSFAGAGFFSSVEAFSGMTAALIPISFSSTSSPEVTILKVDESSFFFSSFGFVFSFGFSTTFGFSATISFGGSVDAYEGGGANDDVSIVIGALEAAGAYGDCIIIGFIGDGTGVGAGAGAGAATETGVGAASGIVTGADLLSAPKPIACRVF
jgi:hypothetical protein